LFHGNVNTFLFHGNVHIPIIAPIMITIHQI
jgi:hypothetical protein